MLDLTVFLNILLGAIYLVVTKECYYMIHVNIFIYFQLCALLGSLCINEIALIKQHKTNRGLCANLHNFVRELFHIYSECTLRVHSISHHFLCGETLAFTINIISRFLKSIYEHPRTHLSIYSFVHLFIHSFHSFTGSRIIKFNIIQPFYLIHSLIYIVYAHKMMAVLVAIYSAV